MDRRFWATVVAGTAVVGAATGPIFTNNGLGGPVMVDVARS